MSGIPNRARVFALALAVLTLGTGLSAGQFRQADGGITVFDDVNFQGVRMTFTSDVPDLNRANLNDRVSSLQVSPNESWEVCEDNNYGGRCVVMSGVARDLRSLGMSDRISSMRRLQGRQARSNSGSRYDGDLVGIAVSDDVDFQGISATFTGDVSDLHDSPLNDRISSLRVAPGESWQVCEHNNYGGRCVIVTGAERDLGRLGMGDVISSMRRVDVRATQDDRGGFNAPRQSRSEIVLFDRPSYRGATQSETGATANLGTFRNRALSAQILDGAWELCEEPGWGGRCVRIESSVPDLQSIGLRGVASARPIDPTR
jgi:hypothetical protein